MYNSSKVRRLVAILLLAVFLMNMGACALAASFKARINSSSAKVYKSPSTSSKYLSGGKGLSVTVTAYSGNWARISYKGYTGYIQLKYLNLTDPLKAYTAKSTPVYRSASSSGRLGTLPVNSTVYVIGKSGSYYRIQNASGSLTGYVRTNTLSKNKVKPTSSGSGSGSSGSSGSSSSGSSSSSASRIDKVIALAKSLVGVKYAISDNPPYSFNCSSFVEYCMEKNSYSMAGTAAGQAAMSNRVSSLSNVQKGDVLCFDTDGNGSCDHTAISLSSGGSSFIEASQGAGKVRIKSMDRYYKSYFMHAIRPK